MIKVFISQGMRGLSENEILNKRNEIINFIKKSEENDVEIIDSYFSDFDTSNIKNKPLFYLSKSLELLANADVAYFCKEYGEYRGCALEHECASKYGIDIKYYD